MKTVIVYRSILGASRQYAEWLHEEIESDLFKFNRINRRTLGNYDLIILCAGTYASWISLGGYLKRRWKLINDKKVVLLVVGLAPIDEELSIRAYRRIPNYIRGNIQYFKLPGRIRSLGEDNITRDKLAPVLDYIKGLEA